MSVINICCRCPGSGTRTWSCWVWAPTSTPRWVPPRAWNQGYLKVPEDFKITEKAPTRAFSWLKAPTSAFTFKTLLRHYSKRALTPRSLNVKLGPRRNYHKGRAAIRHYANQTACPLWPLRRGPNFMLRDHGVKTRSALCLNSVLNVKAVVAAYMETETSHLASTSLWPLITWLADKSGH